MDTRPATFDVELRIARTDGGAGLARDLVRDTLRPGEWRDDVLLVVSELVTNALLHGLGRPVLRLVGTSTQLRVEVHDDNPKLPRVRESGPDGGWGLPLVGRLAVAWGSYPDGVGKTVWCQLAD
jgi:anti-sigma regulatory factor (Ser/Thr protein kinase)